MLVGAVALAGCGDDATDTPVDAGGDAPVAPVDGATKDASVDASPIDAATPDATSDATASDGGNSGPCSSALSYGGYKLVYCTGYDTVGDLDPFNHGQLGGGSLSTTVFKTGPGSFKSVPANVSSGIRSEVQYDEGPNGQTPLEGIIEYDVRYEVVCQDNCHSLQFHPDTQGGSASPGLWHVNGKFVLVNWKNGTNTQYPSGMTIATNQWYHVKLDYKFGATGYMHFFVDGALKIDANNVQVGDGSGQYLKVGVNMWVNQTSVVYYDNLRVYAKQ